MNIVIMMYPFKKIICFKLGFLDNPPKQMRRSQMKRISEGSVGTVSGQMNWDPSILFDRIKRDDLDDF